MTQTYTGGSMILDPDTGEVRPNPNDLARGPARQARIEAGLEEAVKAQPDEPAPLPQEVPDPAPTEAVMPPDEAAPNPPDLTQTEEPADADH